MCSKRCTAVASGLAAALMLAAACSSNSNSHNEPAASGGVSTAAAAASSPRATSTPAEAPGTAALKPTCQVLPANLTFLLGAATSGGAVKLADAITRMRQLEQSAPTGIRPDIKVITDFDQKVLDTVSAGGSPDEIGETPELTAALKHEAAWVSKNCR